MKHLLMIALMVSMFSGSVFALGEQEDFECAALAESNDRANKKIKSEEGQVKEKQNDKGSVAM